MAVVIETTLGDITVDLYLEQRPVTCLNFLKLCKMKYYNFNLFHSIRSGFIAQTGDPSGEGAGGQSIWGILEGPKKQYFSGEKMPKIRHTDAGLLSMVCTGDMMVGSQFFFTLASDLNSLDGVHCVIGEVSEGHDVLRKLNDVICDETHRPFQDVRITHTVVLEDPFNDPAGLRAPSRSPSPSAERLKGGRIAPDEDLDETQGKSAAEIQELIEEKEAKARATILEIVGDLPDADIAPPENVLFVCKLNPVTTDEDLEIIFSRFGKIVSCEVIRDKKTGDSLQYAFIEFADKKFCENAYLKMDNVLIDDRRIHVDFSQSVSKIKWLGKGRGVKHMDDGNLKEDFTLKSRTTRSHSRDNDRSNYHRNEKDNAKKKFDQRERNDREKYNERKSVKNYRERDVSNSERHINYDKHSERDSRGNDKDSRNSKRYKSNEREKRSDRNSSNDYKEREVDKNERKEKEKLLDRYLKSDKDLIRDGKASGNYRYKSPNRHTTRSKEDKHAEKIPRDSSNGGYEKHAKCVEKDKSLENHPRNRKDKEINTEKNKDSPNGKDALSLPSEKQGKNYDKDLQKSCKDSSNERSTAFEKQTKNIENNKEKDTKDSSNEREIAVEKQARIQNNDSWRDLKRRVRDVRDNKDDRMDEQHEKDIIKSKSGRYSKGDNEEYEHSGGRRKSEVDIPSKTAMENTKHNTDDSSYSSKSQMKQKNDDYVSRSKASSNKDDSEWRKSSHKKVRDVKLSPSRKNKEISSDKDDKGDVEVDGHKNLKRHSEKAIPHKSKKAKPSSCEKEKSKAKHKNAEKMSKVDKKLKRKRKQSTSSDSDTSTSSTSSKSSSSEEDRKKRRTKKKRYSSSSSSDSSSSSSSSSSDSSSSSSSSSSSDSDLRKKKRKPKKKIVKKSKKK